MDLNPRHDRLLDEEGAQVMAYILPQYEEGSTSYDKTVYSDSLYRQCFMLLDRIFLEQTDNIKASVYSNRKGSTLSQQFDSCRVACLTVNRRVVTALTYRLTKTLLNGSATMVGRWMGHHQQPV
jgi:hypothetical protein